MQRPTGIQRGEYAQPTQPLGRALGRPVLSRGGKIEAKGGARTLPLVFPSESQADLLRRIRDRHRCQAGGAPEKASDAEKPQVAAARPASRRWQHGTTPRRSSGVASPAVRWRGGQWMMIAPQVREPPAIPWPSQLWMSAS